MSISNKIVISEAFAANLATRETANKIFNLISRNKSKKVYLDFSNVDFVSRSFAHQYELRKIRVRKNLKEIHMNRQIKKMFNKVVENPQPNYKTDFHFRSISLSAKDL